MLLGDTSAHACRAKVKGGWRGKSKRRRKRRDLQFLPCLRCGMMGVEVVSMPSAPARAKRATKNTGKLKRAVGAGPHPVEEHPC